METNPERVAELLVVKGYPLSNFKKKVYDDTDIRDQELNTELNLVREKFASQRNKEEYSIKFWSEVLEHLESITISDEYFNQLTQEETPVKKYVSNPGNFGAEFKGSALIDIEAYLLKSLKHLNRAINAGQNGNYNALKSAFHAFSNMFGLMSIRIMKYSQMIMTLYYKAVALYTVITEEYIKNDRFDLEAMQEMAQALNMFHGAVTFTMQEKGVE